MRALSVSVFRIVGIAVAVWIIGIIHPVIVFIVVKMVATFGNTAYVGVFNDCREPAFAVRLLVSHRYDDYFARVIIIHESVIDPLFKRIVETIGICIISR